MDKRKLIQLQKEMVEREKSLEGPMRMVTGPLDYKGRNPYQRCVLAALDEIYGRNVRSYVMGIVHRMRAGDVLRYLKVNGFEKAKRLPSGVVRLNDAKIYRGRTTIDFDTIRRHAFAYARAQGIDLRED